MLGLGLMYALLCTRTMRNTLDRVALQVQQLMDERETAAAAVGKHNGGAADGDEEAGTEAEAEDEGVDETTTADAEEEEVPKVAEPAPAVAVTPTAETTTAEEKETSNVVVEAVVLDNEPTYTPPAPATKPRRGRRVGTRTNSATTAAINTSSH